MSIGRPFDAFHVLWQETILLEHLRHLRKHLDDRNVVTEIRVGEGLECLGPALRLNQLLHGLEVLIVVRPAKVRIVSQGVDRFVAGLLTARA